MMKIVKNGVITGVGTHGDVSITKEEYESIMTALCNYPAPAAGKDHVLMNGTLEWEEIDVPVIEQTETPPTAEELMDIIMGVRA